MREARVVWVPIRVYRLRGRVLKGRWVLEVPADLPERREAPPPEREEREERDG